MATFALLTGSVALMFPPIGAGCVVFIFLLATGSMIARACTASKHVSGSPCACLFPRFAKQPAQVTTWFVYLEVFDEFGKKVQQPSEDLCFGCGLATEAWPLLTKEMIISKCHDDDEFKASFTEVANRLRTATLRPQCLLGARLRASVHLPTCVLGFIFDTGLACASCRASGIQAD